MILLWFHYVEYIRYDYIMFIFERWNGIVLKIGILHVVLDQNSMYCNITIVNLCTIW